MINIFNMMTSVTGTKHDHFTLCHWILCKIIWEETSTHTHGEGRESEKKELLRAKIEENLHTTHQSTES